MENKRESIHAKRHRFFDAIAGKKHALQNMGNWKTEARFQFLFGDESKCDDAIQQVKLWRAKAQRFQTLAEGLKQEIDEMVRTGDNGK